MTAVAAAMAGRMFGRSANASWKRRSRSSADRSSRASSRSRSIQAFQAFCRSRYSSTTAQCGSMSVRGEAAPRIESGGAAIPDRAMSCRAASSRSPRHNGGNTMTADIQPNRLSFGVRSYCSAMTSGSTIPSLRQREGDKPRPVDRVVAAERRQVKVAQHQGPHRTRRRWIGQPGCRSPALPPGRPIVYTIVCLLVRFAWDGNKSDVTRRIISARRSNRRERRIYAEAAKN